MAVTIYLRDGGQLVILEAHRVTTEILMSDSGFQHALVCRDQLGQIIASFDRESVLAYRRTSPANRQAVVTDAKQIDGARQRAAIGAS